jgi:uncharacterized phage protein (TIGR02218 family)
MREVPPGLAQSLADELTRLAFCWKVTRADGAALGFTSHDRPMTLDGTTYAASPGMEPSAVSASDGIDGGDMEVRGALSSRAIKAEDIADGRYDGARVELRLTDWSAPEAGAMVLAKGSIGDIRRTDTAFEAELRTPAAELDAMPVELCSPECRARLGDQHCRVNLGRLTRLATVAANVSDRDLEVDESRADGAYAYGRMRPLSGRLAGLDFEITGSSGTRITLRDSVAETLRPGDVVELREGCDRRFVTCRDRFDNAVNFRGEPHVPGADSVLRYPSL